MVRYLTLPDIHVESIVLHKMSDYKDSKKKSRNTDTSRMKSGRWYLLCFLVLFLGYVAFAFLRGQYIEVRSYSVSCSAPGKVRIVCLTDLHGQIYGKDQGRIVKKVQAAEPDLIVYLGDMVERTKPSKSMDALVVLTENLTKIAPVYYVDGNHELDVRDDDPELYEKLNKALDDSGAVRLDNETVRIELDNEGTIVNLCGISTHYYWEEEENQLMEELRNRGGINVLLCHYPESVLWYKAFEGGGLCAALCGHTHGGLVQVPFRGGLYAPEWGWWPKYDAGAYPVYTDTSWRNYGGKTGAAYLGTMIVSGGLAGEHGVPRINNPMEISVVDIGK